MYCCEECFDDEILIDHIRRCGRRGICRFCGAEATYVIDAGELEPQFTRFTEIYSPVALGVNVPPDADVIEVGELLANLILDDWGVFSDRLVQSDGHHDLLQEIYKANCREEEIMDAPDVRDLWTGRNYLRNTLLDRWYDLADELRNPEQERAIVLAPQPTEDNLAEAGDILDWFEEDVGRVVKTLPVGSPVFRVRLGYREVDYRWVAIPVNEMGAPPPQRVNLPGRANPVGVSYFYAAEDERTAIAEKRPHTGALATLAMGETLRDLRVIDLVAGMRLNSPFDCPEGYLRSLVESCELFNHLDSEFAKPLRHTDDTHEYRPTQFFAEWAKDHGYEGLRYSSAMTDSGRNLVIFDPSSIAIRSVRLVQIDAVDVIFSDYTGEND